ncbi:hypothetical protein F444_18828, partial [Phytophthora nicotianae P1976]
IHVASKQLQYELHGCVKAVGDNRVEHALSTGREDLVEIPLDGGGA